MQLVDMTVSQYIAALASDAPAPGGGSAAALCGAQGAGLAAMVAGLTIGKKKYAEYNDLCVELQSQANALAAALLRQIDLDTDAFNMVSAAFKLPRDTDEQKSARRDAIAAANLEATRVPLETLRLSAQALEICQKLIGHSNTNAASDLGVAAANLLTCARGAWLNVLINTGDENDAEGRALRAQGQEIVQKAEAMADAVYHSIEEDLHD